MAYTDPLQVKKSTKQVYLGDTKTPIMGGNFGSFTSNLVTDYSYKPIYGTALDPNAIAGNASMNYQKNANQSILEMINAAQSGVNNANGAGLLANAQTGITRMNQFADEASQSAAGMTGAINNTNQTARNLSPYADMLRRYGGDVYNQGLGLAKYSTPYMTGAQDILGLNKDAGGAAGSYINSLLAIDPNAYVGSAASDVQNSFETALGQMQRQLSRSGVDAGSSRVAALTSEWARAKASAQAGAKTRARQTGLTDKLAAMQGSLGVAQNMSGTGANIAGQAAQQQVAGAGLVNQGAGVVAQQGQLYGQAGQLQGQQANAYTAAGQITQGASQLGMGVLNAQNAAAAQLAQAQQAAAQYYSQTASGWGQLAGSNGLISALFS